MVTPYSSDHALLLLLEVLGEFRSSSVVPDEVGVLRVAVQGLQKLWSVGGGELGLSGGGCSNSPS